MMERSCLVPRRVAPTMFVWYLFRIWFTLKFRVPLLWMGAATGCLFDLFVEFLSGLCCVVVLPVLSSSVISSSLICLVTDNLVFRRCNDFIRFTCLPCCLFFIRKPGGYFYVVAARFLMKSSFSRSKLSCDKLIEMPSSVLDSEGVTSSGFEPSGLERPEFETFDYECIDEDSSKMVGISWPFLSSWSVLGDLRPNATVFLPAFSVCDGTLSRDVLGGTCECHVLPVVEVFSLLWR